MSRRALALVVALAMLVVPAQAIASDGHNGAEIQGTTVENDEQHETRIQLPVDGGPQDVGTWNDPVEAEIPAVNLALLPGGKLLYYDGVEADQDQDGATDLHFIWNATPKKAESRVAEFTDDGELAVERPSPVDGGTFDLFCSGTTISPESLAVAPGATEWYTLDQPAPENLYTPLKGMDQTMIFQPDPLGDEDWVEGPDMGDARWYPSALQLPDGDTLVASGIQTLFYPNTYSTLLETYDPDQPADGWQPIDASIEVADGVDVPANAIPEPAETGLAPVDETHRSVPNLPMYPRLHVIPAGPHEGEVLYTANGDAWAPFGWHPGEEVWSYMQTLDTQTGTWEVHERAEIGHRNIGTVVPLMFDAENPEPRYLSLGGTFQQSGVATPTSEIVDASGETVTSELTDSMTFPRWSVNGVLLPDGSVVALGGSTYDNVLAYGAPSVGPLNAERFVPSEDGGGEWELLPGMEDVRAYHSTAVLLPDASVAVAGHVPLPAFHDAQRSTLGNPQPNDTTIETYEPAYLHHGDETRPEIRTAGFQNDLPGEANALAIPDDRQEVTVHLDNVEHGLDSLVLVRPGAATHQYNADQLGVELDVVDQDLQGGSGTVTFEAPHDLAIPPGHYMLFANEDTPDNVYPSEAAWVALGDEVSLDIE
jgi:hypothetical protein